MIWLLLVVGAILMWSATSLLYKAGAHDGKEEHICLKYSVCVGIVFFVIAAIYLIARDEPFSIFESAVRYWPMTAFLVDDLINDLADPALSEQFVADISIKKVVNAVNHSVKYL